MKIFKHLREDWFRYGFETIAVVVGILVAFALDNWNENRKQGILEIRYLNSLKADLVSDTTYYNRRISDSERVIINHREFMHRAYLTQKSIGDVRELFSHITWNSEYLTTQNSTYLELTNSGNLNIISNQELKELILKYYLENEQAATHISEFNEVSTRHLIQVGNVIPNIGKYFSMNDNLYENMDPYLEGGWDYINDPASVKFQTLEYAVTVYNLKHTAFLDHFMILKDLSAQLLREVQNELDAKER